MSARKPVLPELTTAANWAERTAEATAELRAAEAVIRAARSHDHDWQMTHLKCSICRALARLDALRGTR